MTVEASLERAALRVLLSSFSGPELPAEIAELLAEGLGGICLFGSNTTGGVAGVAELTRAIRAAGHDAVIAVDEEGGDVTRLHPGHSPALGAAALGSADDLDLTRATGRAIGLDLVAAGIDLDLGPVADVNSQPCNPVIGARSFGSDPERVAAHVAAWVDGLQSTGTRACAKHFPGHGDTSADSHLELPTLDADLATLRRRELVPFLAASNAGSAAVMTSHIVVAALDPIWPATFSRTVLSLLRDELGFEGALVTDALDMAGASDGRGIPEAAVLALLAGADLLCLGAELDAATVRQVQAGIVEAVRLGRLPEERLVEAGERAGRLRRRTAVSQDPAYDEANREERQDEGASRAVRIEGELPGLAGAAVVTVATVPNIAVGDVAWGLAPDLVVEPHVDVTLPAGVPLVIQVRDAHRHEDVSDLLSRVEHSGVHAVVIEWGWPGERQTALPRICTFGSSEPMRSVVAGLLLQQGWTR